MKKKVCMIVPSFNAKGGITTVVSGYKNSELENEYQIEYIETYCDGGKISKVIKAICAYFKFGKELILNKPDLVHIHSSFGGSFYRKLPIIYMASFFRIPIVNHIHGSAIADLYINASPNKKKLVEKCFDKCQYLVVLSEEWKEKIAIVKTDTPTVVIENYSVIHKDCLRKKTNEIKQILFLGFLTELKGCFDIPEIIEKVIQQCDKIKVILAGSGEDEKIQEVLKKKKLEKYFVFPGWVKKEEKEELLKTSNLFLLPSYTEAMPMSILEAMGYGLPIIASNVGGIPQLVEDGENGFMVKPGNIDGFSAAILKIIQNDNLSYEMGKNSLEKADEKYSLEAHIQKIKILYETVLRRDKV